MKGFNIAPGGQLAPVDEFFASLHHEHGGHGGHGGHHASLSALLAGRLRTSQSSLSDGTYPTPARSRSSGPRGPLSLSRIMSSSVSGRASKTFSRRIGTYLG